MSDDDYDYDYDDDQYNDNSNNNSWDNVSWDRPHDQEVMHKSNPSFFDLLCSMGGGQGLINNMSEGVPSALIKTFGPTVLRLVKRYPGLAALAHFPVIIWFLSTYVAGHLPKLWKWLMS